MARRRAAPTNALGDHIHWEVRWVVPKNGDYKIVVYDCGNDLGEATRVYMKAVSAGKKFATLRSCNVGFPPPEKYRPYTKRVKKKVKKRGKTRTVYEYVEVTPLATLNRKGIFWDPYCRELRKFQEQSGFYIDGVMVPESGIYCPICGVSHRDYHVRRWNPYAHRLYVTGTRRRRSSAVHKSRRGRS